MKKTIYCIIAIIIYFLLVIIKRNVLKKNQNSKIAVIGIVIEIVLFLIFIIAIAYIAGVRFDFENNSLSIFLSERGSDLVWTIVSIIVATTLLNIIKTLLFQKRRKIKGLSEEEILLFEKRTTTMTKVLMSLASYVVYILLAIIILSIWGVNVIPALAGLGIVGLVVGLGAQKLIGDFVSGIFIVFEHHFDVGDTIEVDDFKGTVIDIGLKTTKIKNWEGKVKIIANSELVSIINYSVYNTTFSLSVSVSYDLDPEEVMCKLNEGFIKRFKDRQEIVAIPCCNGISDLGDSGVNISIVGTTKPNSHNQLLRDIRKAVKEICEENNYEIPFPQIVIYRGDNND